MKTILTNLLMLISLVSFGQDFTTIRVSVPNNTDEVYIVGNQENLGDWQPDKMKLKKISEYDREISLNLTFPAEFKFTRGNWKSEANVFDYENGSNIKLIKKTTNEKFIIESYKDEKITRSRLSLTYDIKYLTSLEYPNEERVIRVFLPKNYDPSKKYPVVYTLDGQSLFNQLIQNMSVLQDMNYDENNIIPECITVGIDNTNRNRDLSPNTGQFSNLPVSNFNKGSEIFYKILNQEIVPFINNNYSVSGFNVIIGHSDAGNFVSHLFLRDDNNFNGVIALSVNDFQNYFQKSLPNKLNQNNSKLLFLGYGNKDDEFNILGDFLAKQNLENPNFKLSNYNADHMQLPFTSLFDGVKFMFSDYKFYDKLISETFNDDFDYQTFKKLYINTIAEKYGIETDIDYDIYYLLNKARDKNDQFVFHKLLDEIDRTNSLQLQIRFFAASEFHQNDRAKSYLYQMLESKDETDKLIFYANLDRQYYGYFVNQLNQPIEFIDFLEKAINKWPEYKLEFTYLVLKVTKETQLKNSNYSKQLKYCENNFKENRYFTFQELQKLKEK